MSESFDDQVSRVELMAGGDPQWDLSPNDQAALSALLAEFRRLKLFYDQLRTVDIEKTTKEMLVKAAYECGSITGGLAREILEEDVFKFRERGWEQDCMVRREP